MDPCSICGMEFHEYQHPIWEYEIMQYMSYPIMDDKLYDFNEVCLIVILFEKV